MLAFVRWLHLIALIVWVGEVVFFSFVVAPVLFRTFSPAEAGQAVGAILPIYYRIAYGCGVLLLISSLVLLATSSARLWLGMNALLVAGMLAATIYVGTVIQPQAAALRPQLHVAAAPAGAQETFDRLHRLAVAVNGAVLVGGVMVSIITAATWRS